MDIGVLLRRDLVGSRGGTCRGAFLEESRILCCARFPFIRAAMRLPNWGRSWKLLARKIEVRSLGDVQRGEVR